MQRFYVPSLPPSGMAELPVDVARQVTTVLRMRPGDPLVLFDGSGGEWDAELAAAGRGGTTATLIRHRQTDTDPEIRVTLCQALLKADKLEWVLQKGTELGVSAFLPLLTERAVPSPHGEAGRLATRIARWRRIVVEAVEQSGRCIIPEVHPPVPLAEALAHPGGKVLCWEGERHRTFVDAFAAVRARGAPAAVFIGPEGGFSAAEAKLAHERGALLAALGPRVLRSETAAVAAVTLALLAPG